MQILTPFGGGRAIGELIAAGAALSVAPAPAQADPAFVSRRPPPGERRFRSPVVDAAISAISVQMADRELACARDDRDAVRIQ